MATQTAHGADTLRVLAGLLVLALAAVAVWFVISQPGVYWAKADVILIAPAVASNPNNLQDGSSSLISMAGIIERELTGDSAQYNPNGPEVTIIDRGIMNGITVRVPNYGGQWATNFSHAVLDVEASGPTPEIVEQRMNQTISAIKSRVLASQAAFQVRPDVRITTSISPQELQIRYSVGDRKKAVGAIGLVALIAAGALSVGPLVRVRATAPPIRNGSA